MASALSLREAGTPQGGPSTERIRIVIADDHAIFRDGLRRLLSLEPDFEVVGEASDGEETLQVVEESAPDILLLDLRMPGLDGLEVLERLRMAPCRPKVIILTASDAKAEFVQAMKLGSSGIVLKHTPTAMLCKSIRKVHAGEIWLDSITTAAVMREFAGAPEPSGEAQSQRRSRNPLSQRERQIVALVARGYKNKEIAEKLFISEQTVKNHLHNIFDKLGVSDRLELALYAIHNGLHDQDQG